MKRKKKHVYVWNDDGFTLFKHNDKKEGIDSDKVTFLLSMLQENMAHARHVEMEKISYSTLHTALVVAAVVFIGDISDVKEELGTLLIRLIFCLGLTFLCLISFKFHVRWSDVFDYHKECAAGCYYILHRDLINGKKPQALKDKKVKPWRIAAKYFRNGYYDVRLKIRKKPGEKAKSCLNRLPLFPFTIDIMKSEKFSFHQSIRAVSLFMIYNLVLLFMVIVLSVYISYFISERLMALDFIRLENLSEGLTAILCTLGIMEIYGIVSVLFLLGISARFKKQK